MPTLRNWGRWWPEPRRRARSISAGWNPQELGDFIRSSPMWKDKDELLRSTPGVGPVLSMTLLSELPELGALNRGEIAA